MEVGHKFFSIYLYLFYDHSDSPRLSPIEFDSPPSSGIVVVLSKEHMAVSPEWN